MTPRVVYFTNLALDPADCTDRVHGGVIPTDWARYRYATTTAIPMINRRIAELIEGRWAILSRYINGTRTITIAFEQSYDATWFVLNDGERRCETDES